MIHRNVYCVCSKNSFWRKVQSKCSQNAEADLALRILEMHMHYLIHFDTQSRRIKHNHSRIKKSPRKRCVFGGLASLAGFEPTTFRLGGGRSILLSYRNIYDFFPYFQGFPAFGFGLPGFQIVHFSLDVLDVFRRFLILSFAVLLSTRLY